jgi:DNA replication and repair protein RecF
VWVGSLQLHNFRNFEQLTANLTQGLNLIYGENGRGKTNLVEGVFFLGSFESHRIAANSNLIRAGQNSATISVTANSNRRALVLASEINRSSANRYFLNGNQQRRVSEVSGVVKSLIFAPEDLDLVRRDPQDRRFFLDQALALLKPRLAGVRSDYDRVLKQRNALLKSARQTTKPELSTLEIWDEQLVSLGSEIISARIELVSALQPLLSDFYQALANSQERIEMSIQSSIASDDDESLEPLETPNIASIAAMFKDKLEANRARELERGITLFGPHRDELLILKDGLPARTQSSQGEAWSIALGLKLSLGDLMRTDSTTGDPILILDDVFAVLDAGRRERLVKFVSSYEQVIITSADRESAPNLEWSTQLEVLQGGLVEAQL